jgi:outer membrane protein, heavy metal efflux system
MKILKSRQFTVWVLMLAGVGFFTSTIAAPATATEASASLSLSNFIKINLADNPEFLALKAELQSARATLRASDQAVYNPELELDYEDIDDIDSTTQTVGISQTIDWGDLQGSRTAIGRMGLQKAIASYKLASQSFLSELLKRQADHQTQNALQKLSNESLKLMMNFKAIAENRYRAGDLSQVELNLALLAYHQALMEQANVQADTSEAREKLRVLLGGFVGDSFRKLPDLPEQLPVPKIEGDLDAFLQTLPLVKVQLAELQLSRNQVELKKSEQAWNPTIGVRAGKEEENSLIGFSLSIPLNVRNNFSAEVDAAQQESIATEQRAHIAFRDARARIIVTTERYRSLLTAWNNWRKYSRSSVDQQLLLIKKLWQAGDISAADYLLQLKQALETRATGLELRNQLWQVAFEWMSLTDRLDDWLNIQIELPGKN